MKLRLPNKLIAALLSTAAPALFSTLSTATLGAAAVGAICQQAEAAQWSADNQTHGHAYYYLERSGAETEIDTLTTPTADAHDFVNQQSSVTDNYVTVGIVAGVADQQVHIGTVAAANGQTFMIAQRPWDGQPNINVLIDTLEFAAAADSEEEYGSGSFTVNANQTATLKKVNGTLTSLTNDGTLTLDGTFDVKNTLSLGDNSQLNLAENSSLTYSAALTAAPLEKILNKTQGDGTLILTLPDDGDGMEMYGTNFAFNVKNTVFQGGTDGGTYMLRINSNGSATKIYNISAEQSLTFNNAYLRLEGDTTMNVSGALTVTGGNLQLGHTNSGGHYGRLNISEGANVVLSGIKVWNNTSATDNNQLNMSGGVLQITGSQMFDSSSTMNTTAVNFTGGTLKADGNSWTLNQNANIGNVTMNATGNATLTVSGTLSDAVGYAGSITKTGSGTLKLSGAMNYTGATTVSEGTLIIENQRYSNKTHQLGDISLGQGTTLQSYFAWYDSGTYSTYQTILGAVSLAGDAAIIESSNFGGLNKITGLSGSGTLTLKNACPSTVHTTFSIGGSATTAEQTTFHGTLDVQHTNNSGDNRGTVVVFNDEYTAADAVLNMTAVATTNSRNRILGIGLNSDTVKLKGIHDKSIGAAAGANSQYLIFSGSGENLATIYDGSTSYFDNATDGEIRTLELTGDGSYSTAAKVGANINITMNGTGTQTFAGDLSAFNGNLTVNSGTLAISGTTLPQDGTGTLGTIALNGGTLKIGSGDGAHTSLSSFSSVTMAGGVLYYNNKKDTLHNVTAQAGKDSRIFSLDMGKANEGSHLTLAGTTTLNGNLTIHNYWNASFVVEKLTGAGTLNVTGGTIDGAVSGASNEAAEMTISSLQGFTGSLTFNNSKLSATVNTGTAAVSMGTLTVSNHSAVTVTSSSTATLTASALALSGNANLEATSLTLNGADVTVSGNITANGGGSVNVTGTSAITASKIVVDGNNTKLSFGQHVTLTHNDYTSFSGSGKELHFNGGMSYTGTGGRFGYALVIGNGSKAYFGGETDLSERRVGQDTGSEIIVESGASLKVKSMYNSTGTPANNGAVTVKNNAQFEAVSEGMVASVFTNAGTSVIRGANMEITSKLDNSGTLTFHNSGSGKVATMTQTGENAVLNLSDNVDINTSLAQDGSLEGSINLGSGASLNIKNLGAEVSASLKDLTLAQNATMGVYTDNTTNATAEGDISVSGTLTSKADATLNANLTLNNGATLAVAEGGLHMGSTLTIAEGAKVSLSDNIISGLNSLTVGSGLTLFSGVDSFTIDGITHTEDYMSGSASNYFNLAGVNRPWDFVIKYEANTAADGGTVSLWMETPEPATATLSLLALAALAARRKRH